MQPSVLAIGLVGLAFAVIAIIAAIALTVMVLKADRGTPLMNEIAAAIRSGAKSFLHLEYSTLTLFVVLMFCVVSAAVNWQTGICYLGGAATSATAGYIGMMIATAANVRTAAAAEHGLNPALRVAFNSGSVMGLVVVGSGLGMISILYMIFGDDAFVDKRALAGFGMGASTVSIFARVGGGIFTKAADVGADLVGKVEKNIPEDDARNPATIADNVGDNVGDVAGMGADLFSSFVGSIIASSLLGVSRGGQALVALPYWIAATGIIASLLGMTLVRTRDGASQHNLLWVLRRAVFAACAAQCVFMAIVVAILDVSWKLYAVLVLGLVTGVAIGVIAEYFTSAAYGPTQAIAHSSVTGPAGVVIKGLSVGMMSVAAPAILITSLLLAAESLAGVYGIALASTGLLSTLSITLATDAYGPVADNAGGIAEMAHMPAHVRANTDLLDALGNTTAAVGKGFAVASAVLTAIALLVSFSDKVALDDEDFIRNKYALAGLLLGAVVPYVFAALTMGAVATAAGGVVTEVRRQFREIPGIMEGTAKPDHARCVRMLTAASLHSMLFPALLVVLTPLVVGIGLGPVMLAGTLLGAIFSGFSLAAMMACAGGAWDNAKKYIESGHMGGKGSECHRAAVVGDTIGDPFKDTSGPALNILIKLMSYISVVFAPVFKKHDDIWWVALIILAVMAVLIPLWRCISPKWSSPMSTEDIMVSELSVKVDSPVSTGSRTVTREAHHAIGAGVSGESSNHLQVHPHVEHKRSYERMDSEAASVNSEGFGRPNVERSGATTPNSTAPLQVYSGAASSAIPSAIPSPQQPRGDHSDKDHPAQTDSV